MNGRPLVRFLVLFGVAAAATAAPALAGGETQSVARQWNERLLEAIRVDFARPTVHARNLFHTSVAMYDAWAAYDDVAVPWFLGRWRGSYFCEFDGVPEPVDVQAAREEAISYATYRLLKHRFADSPGADRSVPQIDSLFVALGYDSLYTATDYTGGDAAALGNYIAEKLIDFGYQDGSNELNGYENQYYEPVNEPLLPELPGNPDMEFPNRWQPLGFDVFIDQSGNPIADTVPPFLSPEWGQVVPFSLDEEHLTIFHRDGFDYWVYYDPGFPPPLLPVGYFTPHYQWNHTLVAIWSSHLDPADGVMWDISPASIGNIQYYPTDREEHPDFYDLYEGGDPGIGWDLNPVTGEPYEPQIVPRADYARCLAEFWADGPKSETPPGHWFTILNYVNDHPLFEKRFKGEGAILDELEWDVKAYFILGGTMHDCAVTAWGIKGWYDYVRPISAIRYMNEVGQCTDPGQARYDLAGMPLHPGFVEVVEVGDPLASDPEAIGRLKLFAWKGPEFIEDPETDVAGVDWILADNWWPYQRPTFVTPPFAGYVSGHSTFSRAAAEVMTLLTGDEFFPGGMGEFFCPQNEFLVFEDGPSVDLTLQWATYRDASDQTSLSRIWGGIHPPADDIPGRLIGIELGPDAFHYAEAYFNGSAVSVGDGSAPTPRFVARNAPNPFNPRTTVRYSVPEAADITLVVHDAQGREVATLVTGPRDAGMHQVVWDGRSSDGLKVASGTYFLQMTAVTAATGQEFVTSGKMVMIK